MSPTLTILICVVVLALTFYALHRITDSYFVQSLEILSDKMRMTSDIAGASLMAMGSSAPELFTSLLALVKSPDLADLGAGTIVGSAIFNILVIVGGSAIVGASVLSWQPAIRDLLFYLCSILLLYFVFLDGMVTLTESIYFVAFYVLYLIALPVWRRIFPYEDQAGNVLHVLVEAEEQRVEETPWYWWWTVPIDKFFYAVMPDLRRNPTRYLWTFMLSIALIALLSWVLVESGVILASTIGIPQAIIALTVLAVGTSVPDLLSSLIVAKKGKGDMAISNAVGSNIFDILVGLGVVWMVMISIRGEPIQIGRENLNGSIVLLLATVAAMLFLLLASRWHIGRKSGIILIGLYVVYIIAAVTGLM